MGKSPVLFGAVESAISPWGSLLAGTHGHLKSGELFHLEKNILHAIPSFYVLPFHALYICS